MNATFQPFIISLSDLLGRKTAILGSVAIFTLGTLLCCLSQTVVQLLAGRAIQGIGAGGVTTLPNVIFADFVPLRQRPKFIALNQLSWAIGTIIGPLIGGLLVDHATWRWCFYINFPFCAIGIVMIPLVVRLPTNRPSLVQIALNLDWGGAFLFTASLFSFLFGITCGGTQYEWKDWRSLLPICLGLVGIVVTILWESRIAKPMLRLSIFNSVSSYAAYTATILQGVLVRKTRKPTVHDTVLADTTHRFSAKCTTFRYSSRASKSSRLLELELT
jgi:MFS family permease